MSRLTKKSPSVCTDLPLDNTDISNKLHLLKQLLQSSYGPTGRLKQIHNNIGGHVTTTSSSSVLLPSISSSQPLINLIKSSIFNHVSRFSDCGLFAAIMCLSLIEEVRQSGLRRSVAIRVNKHLLDLCCSYLRGEDCGCKVDLDFCSSLELITLARSVISSKPACVLDGAEGLHISRMSVQAFLLTVPCSSSGTVRLGRALTVGVEGPPVLQSAVFPGLLLEAHDALSLKMVENLQSSPLRVVLFGASLAGDLPELGDGVIEVPPGVETDSQILDQLLQICTQVVGDGVKLFVCQKVIHPVLQQLLRGHGVVVVERVGVGLMEPLVQLTGAQPVATLHTAVPATAYGTVRAVSVKQFGSRTLLHLQPEAESGVCTTVLCHRNQTMLNELKVVCQQAEHVLRLTLRDPSALLGGGCTETHLAAHVRNKSRNEVTQALSALGCSQTEYLLGVEVFCRSLESVAAALQHDGGNSFVDLTHAHHWSLPADVPTENMEENLTLCGCGLVSSGPSTKWAHVKTEYPQFSPAAALKSCSVRPRVLDSFTAKVNALEVAVETANLVLDVRFIIQDTN